MFEKIESDKLIYENLKDDIDIAWKFLQVTHSLKENEVITIRIQLQEKYNNRFISGCKELIINNFDDVNYSRFYGFCKKYSTHRDGSYNFYYSTFKTTYNEYARKIEDGLIQNRKCIGIDSLANSTNILIVDIDEYEYSSYLKYKQLFIDKGIETIDVFSGHGFHFLIKVNDCYDKDIFRKFAIVLENYNIPYDSHCVNPSRVFRLPGFYNPKRKPYSKSFIMNDLNVKTYDVEDVFEKFGFDYNEIQLKEKVKKVIKKEKVQKDKVENNNTINKIDLSIYGIENIDTYSNGIKNMLMGLREGSRYYQVWCLTIFFKRRGYSLDKIEDIMTILENINGNNGNSWNVINKVNDFYEFNGINSDDLFELEKEFGEIKLPQITIEDNYKIPLGICKPQELQVYMYLLMNGNSKKVDIVKSLGISKNTLDSMMKNSSIIERVGKEYRPLDVVCSHYLYINKLELEKFLMMNKNEISVYSYLKFRCGNKKEIRTSLVSMEQDTKLSHGTLTTTIKQLEEHKFIKVIREKCNFNKFLEVNRVSNTYIFI